MFVGLQIREIMRGIFDETLNEVEGAAWAAFKAVTKNFLGGFGAANCEPPAEELGAYKFVACKNIIKN